MNPRTCCGPLTWIAHGPTPSTSGRGKAMRRQFGQSTWTKKHESRVECNIVCDGIKHDETVEQYFFCPAVDLGKSYPTALRRPTGFKIWTYIRYTEGCYGSIVSGQTAAQNDWVIFAVFLSFFSISTSFHFRFHWKKHPAIWDHVLLGEWRAHSCTQRISAKPWRLTSKRIKKPEIVSSVSTNVIKLSSGDRGRIEVC